MKRLTRRQALRLGFYGSLAGLGLDAFVIEPRWLQFERHEIPIKGLGKDLDGYRIALLSDVHYPYWIRKDQMDRAAKLAMDFKPDAIVMPGDFIDSKAADHCPDMGPVFSGLRAPDGVLATLGNHDHWCDPDGLNDEFAKHGVVNVENRPLVVSRGSARLALTGVGDKWEGEINWEKALDVPENVPRIVLSHNPDVAEFTPEGARVDLMLSGHTHGGQVRVPFRGAIRLPSEFGNKYEMGLVEGPRHRVYVTRGVGCLRPVRFLCRPEVTGLVLRAA